jgi:hypothetical protein
MDRERLERIGIDYHEYEEAAPPDAGSDWGSGWWTSWCART